MSKVYLDFNIINNTDRKKLARETINLPASVIDDPENYQLSIIRFLLQPSDLPIHVFRIEQGITQTDPNLGLFKIGFRYTPTGDDFMVNLEWTPEDTSNVIIPPNAPSANDGLQVDDQYYFMYSYKHLANLANSALADALTLLRTAQPTVPNVQPYIVFNEKRNTYDFYIPEQFCGASDVTILINDDSLKFLEGQTWFYDFQRDVYELQPDILPLELNAYWLPSQDPSTDPITYYYFPAEFSVLEKLHSPKKILFTSNSLPVNQEWVNTKNIYKGLGNTSESLPIISDFSIISNQAGATLNDFLYIPSAEYRRLTLNSSSPVKNIDVSIYWLDDYNVLWPLELRPGSISSCKILFEKN